MFIGWQLVRYLFRCCNISKSNWWKNKKKYENKNDVNWSTVCSRKGRSFYSKPKDVNELNTGEIGFIITGIKNLSDTKVGDTICDVNNPLEKALPGFKPSKPVVFCGLFWSIVQIIKN